MPSEKEKMLAGQLYNSKDSELQKELLRARRLMFEFNHSGPDEVSKRTELLKQLMRFKGSFNIEPPFYCDFGSNIDIGNNFYANFGCVILDVNKVQIGDNVLLGPSVQIYSATHPTDPEIRLTGLELGKPITIGNNVWVGGSAVICPGVKIGNNVTIGAGSVVTRDIPDNVVAAGNPCRIIKTV